MHTFYSILILWLLSNIVMFGQVDFSKYSIEASVFHGQTLEHNAEIAHLLTSRPSGFSFSWNTTVDPEKYWSYKNNFPELGVSFLYHNSHVEALGTNYSLYGHIHWYFAARHLQLKLAQGVAYADNPYHPDKNYRNNAYGSKLLSATRLELNFVKKYIFHGLGIYTGLGIVHYSNGATKKPNTSTNTGYAHIGMRYDWEPYKKNQIGSYNWEREKEGTRWFYEVLVRSGANQSGIGESTRGFFVAGGSVGKRWSYRSGWHIGGEFFYSPFLKDHIRFRSIAYPEMNYTGREDTNRVGLYVGYDLYISDELSLYADLGYYLYWPVQYERRVYNRAGIKYQIADNPLFAVLGVKAHFSKAESLEIGIGYKW